MNLGVGNGQWQQIGKDKEHVVSFVKYPLVIHSEQLAKDQPPF